MFFGSVDISLLCNDWLIKFWYEQKRWYIENWPHYYRSSTTEHSNSWPWHYAMAAFGIFCTKRNLRQWAKKIKILFKRIINCNDSSFVFTDFLLEINIRQKSPKAAIAQRSDLLFMVVLLLLDKKSKCVKRDNRYSFMWKTNHKLLSSIVRAQHNRQFPSPSIVSWGLEVTPSATPFSKGLTKLAILPDYECPGSICLALRARRKFGLILLIKFFLV